MQWERLADVPEETRGGDRKSNVHDDRLKLLDLHISENQSKRAQLLAVIPSPEFEAHIDAEEKKHSPKVWQADFARTFR